MDSPQMLAPRNGEGPANTNPKKHSKAINIPGFYLRHNVHMRRKA
jgi:hypothetical protein